jgi:MYXO-CTERM domain-containing protein
MTAAFPSRIHSIQQGFIIMRHSIHETSARGSRLAGASLAFALLATTAPAWAQSNRSIINGGFEQPPIPAGTFQLIDDSNIPGWETSATDNVMELWGTGFNFVPAFAGNQFAELNANEVATLFQPLCLVPGDAVNWSFAHRGRLGVDTIRLTIGTDQITTVSTGDAEWSVNAGTYTPNITASAPVQFFFESVSSAGGSQGVGNFLDDVQIVLPPHYEISTAPSSGDEASGDTLPILLVSGTLTTAGSVTVNVSGTATQGDDFTFAATVAIPAGEYDGTAATGIPLGITIIDDSVEEADETIAITIADPTGENAGNPARIADVDCNDTSLSTATFTITDNDGMDCGNATVEGAEGCDDGNLASGDGCSAACAVEVDYICSRADFSLVAEDALLGDTNEPPDWQLSADGFTVFQAVNSDPGVYVSSLPAMNIGDIEFTIAVETTGDDDFVGVVLGFDGQEFAAADASYLLIDWKQETQDASTGIADEGLAVSLVTGPTTLTDLWSHPEGGTVRELARGVNFGAVGWEDNVTYTWTLNYTETTLTLRVNGVEEINIQAADVGLASFPPGSLGFYNYSQSDVRYSLLSPRGRSICTPDPDDRCTGFDDDLDADADGVPDGCDLCASGDDAIDADDDGTPDACDLCANADDAIDADGDDLPDGCDTCAMDPGNDEDGDGVCGNLDNCPAADNDDQADLDGDGVGDACDGDRYGVQGGGCGCAATAQPGDMGGMLILFALAWLLGWRRRRQARAA